MIASTKLAPIPVPISVTVATEIEIASGGESRPNAAAGGAHGDTAGRPAREQAEGDAGEMKQAGRDHEADGESNRIGSGRQLVAVGMAVEDRERADEQRSDPQWGARRERHHQPE